MNIAIEINGVLRDVVAKIEQVYQKYLIDEMGEEPEFVYEMNLPVTSFEFGNHFNFKDDEEFYSFLYEEFVIQIFGHAHRLKCQLFMIMTKSIKNTKKNIDSFCFQMTSVKRNPQHYFLSQNLRVSVIK